MTKPEEIITDAEIDAVHANANFGEDITKRDVVKAALLKWACRYSNGSTATQIIKEHGLIVEKGKKRKPELTDKGRKYLYASFVFDSL
ncbi:hypothetical protein [Kiloniella laminariae]|uniref:hypothetical protein n=1 Tax=Kiloniella laminariae TaxID=454162 RepID=UPI0003708693|nr:hypothetical protein [Kiloniella laminariae]